MKIVFFGTNRLAQIVLEELIKSNYKPQLIITAPDKKAGRGQERQMSPVKQTALKNNLEILQPKDLYESNVKSRLSNVDLSILVAYGQIIPKEILIAPKYGFINVHPSLLPKYRGPSPIQTAILSDDKKIGISIIILDELIDHGPILIQKKITISPKDTHLSLVEYLGKIGARLLIQILPEYLAGSLKPKTQNHSQATFSKRIKKSNGYIDLNNPPDSKTFDRMIRAFYPWPGVYTKLKIKNEKLKIIKFLPGNLIQPEGKRPMTTKEFLNGYPETKKFIGELLNGDNST
ncbi:methionyl-tRNA formyltransferase [Candidatus Curtissbacteria bacterium RIFCSPLOWO2_02_41_11]|uniref:Methionyl-tRNA formyltransferase n=1 Tax=Candidatus Curtissbacteria bacterium RIFCSPLOWO2_02_41_11 TaxID=1797731 RepID=A0A1F5HU75_9BACT|nr:MAG: methionyl-tRNA formyltransferase [Candidatus Curtissbacteria bacterium RIFCSPLOWO2_02_41_11]